MRAVLLASALALVACGGATPAPKPPPPLPSNETVARPSPPPDPNAWRNGRPKAGPPAEIHYPDVEVGRLDNGFSVYVVRRPVGVASISVVSRGGGSRLPLGKSGLAALTARMMTEGTTKRSSLALAEAAESLGATLEESAGRDYVRLGLMTARTDFEKGVELLSEVAQKPSFSNKELERVRKEWLDSIEDERQSPSRLASLAGLRLLLGNALGAPVNGSKKDVQGLKRDDLVKFHRETFVPDNLALLVVGDLPLSEVQAAAQKYFGQLHGKAGKAAPPPELPAAPASTRVVLVDRPGSVQSSIFIAQPFPKRADPGYETRELLNEIVGGLFTSRLNTNLREEHAYTYGATSVDIATRDWGTFVVMTQVRTDVTAEALGEAVTELSKARDATLGRPITDAEVNVARADLKQHLGASLVHAGEVAARVQDLFVHQLPPDYYRKYPATLDSLGTVQVVAESGRLDATRAVIVVVGDKSQVEPKLRDRFKSVETPPEGLLD
jgi:zinc protease